MQPALWDHQITNVAKNATPGWCDAAYAAVVRVASRKLQFTTDDVWQEIAGPVTHDNRALGAVMRRARTEKVCEPTMQYTPSTRDVCHGRPVRVWRSIL